MSDSRVNICCPVCSSVLSEFWIMSLSGLSENVTVFFFFFGRVRWETSTLSEYVSIFSPALKLIKP